MLLRNDDEEGSHVEGRNNLFRRSVGGGAERCVLLWS